MDFSTIQQLAAMEAAPDPESIALLAPDRASLAHGGIFTARDFRVARFSPWLDAIESLLAEVHADDGPDPGFCSDVSTGAAT